MLQKDKNKRTSLKELLNNPLLNKKAFSGDTDSNKLPLKISLPKS